MGSLKRQLARKQNQKKVKKAKKNLKQALNATLGLPTSCTTCSVEFEPEDADKWMVAVYDDIINLNCPDCYKKASESE